VQGRILSREEYALPMRHAAISTVLHYLPAGAVIVRVLALFGHAVSLMVARSMATNAVVGQGADWIVSRTLCHRCRSCGMGSSSGDRTVLLTVA